MKFVDEYRDPAERPQAAPRAIARITTQPWTIMEVCGGQTHASCSTASTSCCRQSVTLVHGPGCPVCVTPLETDRPGHRRSPRGRRSSSARSATCCACPGSRGDLLRSRPAAATCASSTRRSTRLTHRATRIPTERWCSSRVGFETTAPANAMAVFQAREQRARELLDPGVARPGAAGDGGHPVARRTTACRASWPPGTCAPSWATRSTSPLAARYRVPIVVTGFEPLDILQGILHVRAAARERAAPRSRTSTRASCARGQPPPRRSDRARSSRWCARKWRGIGEIPDSGLAPARRVRRLRRRAPLRRRRRRTPTSQPECISGLVLQGVRKPHGVPGVRHALHAGAPARRHHGLVRGRLRRLLPLPAHDAAAAGSAAEP